MESADLTPVNQTAWYHIVSEKLPIHGKEMIAFALWLRYYFSYEREGPLWEARMISPFCSVERECMIT
jgi:hypothetical protein